MDGENASRFEWVCTEGIESGALHLILDVVEMDYVSSMGLRGFLTAAKELHARGGKVTLCGLHGLPKQVFEITHLLPMFGQAETTDQALAALSPAKSHWITVSAESESLSEIARFVRQGAGEAKIPTGDLQKLDLVLEELLLNVANHAYPDGVGSVEVGYTVLEPGRLRVEFCDTGKPFNPLEAAAPDLSEDVEKRKVGGLGLLLVKSLTHNVRYQRDTYRNIVSLELLAARAAEA